MKPRDVARTFTTPREIRLKSDVVVQIHGGRQLAGGEVLATLTVYNGKPLEAARGLALQDGDAVAAFAERVAARHPRVVDPEELRELLVGLGGSLPALLREQPAESQAAAPVAAVTGAADLADDEGARVSSADVLNQVHDFLGRFVVYPSSHARVAHTLWIAHAHLMDAWESTPRLAFLSPEPASGKTRALEITELLVPRPVEALNMTAAYLFRKVGDPPAGRPSCTTRLTRSSGRRPKRTKTSAGCSMQGTGAAPWLAAVWYAAPKYRPRRYPPSVP